MKQIALFIIFFVNLVDISYASEIIYKLGHNQKKGFISVELEFKGNDSGRTNLYVPILSQMAVKDGDLQFALRGESPDVSFDVKKGMKNCISGYPMFCDVILLNHRPGEKIKISYEAYQFADNLIYQNDILIAGDAAFVLPILDKDSEISIDWSQLPFKTAKKISSSRIENVQKIKANQEDLFASWYLFSNSKIEVTQISKSPKYNLITIGFPSAKNKKPFTTHEKLVQLTQKIVSYNQKFIDNLLGFKNEDPKTIVIINLPGEAKDYSGIMKKDFFLIRFHNEEYDRLAKIISHELLHQIFGNNNKVSVGFGPNDYYDHYRLWFDEGFTDYFANLLNLENNIITEKQYINILNNDLNKYYRYYAVLQDLLINPCLKDLPKVKLSVNQDTFFFEHQYLMGHLFALDLDNLIRNRSFNKYQLKDLLKNLISNCKKFPCRLNKSDFVSGFNKLIPNHREGLIDTYIDNYITGFTPIKLPDNILSGKAVLSGRVVDWVYDLGFDYAKTMCTGIISGVEKGSNAFKAGLRNQEVMKDFTFLKGLETSIVINKDGKTEKLVDFEAVAKKPIPYYVLK